MGYGIIDVWIRNRNCTVATNAAGTVTVTPCCVTAPVATSGTITAGHYESIKLPPGCYIAKAHLTAPVVKDYEIMVGVGCGKTSCTNFLLPG
jgi:hypothetical protein